MKKAILLLTAIYLITPAFSQPKNPKRGIAYGYHSEEDFQSISGTLSWWYNWAVTPESGVADIFESYDMDFVPMAWNGQFNETNLRNFYASHPDAKFLLGFNEPNFIDQANMTPGEAAVEWSKLESVADDYGLELVGPAVNWCGKCVSEGGVTFTNPYEYLDSFFVACKDCRVDYIAVHNYMCYSGPLIDYLEELKKYGKKIWLTEFACGDQATITLDMQKSLMIGALDYLDNDTMIYRYSWFIGRSGPNTPPFDIFESEPGLLTELGELYVNYNALHDTSIYYPVPARIEAESYSEMSGISLEGTSDFDGLANVGWIDAGDWLQYNIDVADSSNYYLYLRIAATNTTSLDVIVDESSLGNVNITSTGGWQNWKTFSIQILLNKGKARMKLYANSANFNINWLRISTRDNTSPTCSGGEDQEIIFPVDTAVLYGTGNDADGDTLQYKWIKVSGPDCNFSSQDDDTVIVTGLSPGNYTFRLRVSDGFDVASDNVVIKVIDISSAGNAISAKKLSVYPNPVTNTLNVMLPETGKTYKLRVLNATGQVVLSDELKDKGTANGEAPGTLEAEEAAETGEIVEVDLGDLTRGFYFVVLVTDNRIYTTRFVK
jgi:hypothetical protein